MPGTSNASALYPYFPFFYILHFLFSPSSSFSSHPTCFTFSFASFLGGVLRASAFCACLSLLLRFLQLSFYNLNFFLVPFVQLLTNMHFSKILSLAAALVQVGANGLGQGGHGHDLRPRQAGEYFA